MGKITIPLFALGVMGLLGGCSGSATPSSDDPDSPPTHPVAPSKEAVGRPVASVEGLPVGTVGLDRARGMKRPSTGGVFSDEEKQAFLDDAIVEELMFQEAFERGLYHDLAIRRAMVAALLKEEVYDSLLLPELPEEEMRDWFKDHRDMFIIPERVHLQRIFLVPGASRSPEDTSAAIEALRQTATRDPERFTELAREHSDGPLALRSGDAGFITLDGRPGVPPAIVDKAFSMEPGTISEPFEHGGGWNLVRVVDRRDRIARSFEQVRASVKRRMNEEVIEGRRAALAERLRAEADVDIDTKALTSWRPALLPDRMDAGREMTPKPAPTPPEGYEADPPSMRQQMLEDMENKQDEATP